MAGGSQRQPQPMYRDHDGFTERVLLKMSGAVPPAKCNLHLVANHPENASREDLRELRDAVQRRQLAEDVMHLGGTYFPGYVYDASSELFPCARVDEGAALLG